MRISQFKTAALVIPFALTSFFLIINEILRFEVWEQVEFMSKADIDISSLGMMAHLPRYLVVYPAYFASEFLNIPLESAYGNYIFLITLFTSLLWIKSRALIVLPRYRFAFIFVAPYVLLFLVSGRFIFGLFGLSLLLHISIRHIQSGFSALKAIGIALGLLYCSISSGVFTVGLLFLIITKIKENKNKSRVEKIKAWIGLGLMLTPALMLMGIFLAKNVLFYQDEGYGILGMLSHGLGMALNPEPVLEACRSKGDDGATCGFALLVSQVGILIPLIFMIAVVLPIYYFLRSLRYPRMAMRGITLSAIGGLFGITTLLSFIFILPICVNRSHLSDGNI